MSEIKRTGRRQHNGTKPPNWNVGSSVAVGAKLDMTQPGLPSRSHAIRELVVQALDAAEAKHDKKPKA